MLINKFVSASYGKLLNCAKQITPKDVSEYAPGCVVQYNRLRCPIQQAALSNTACCMPQPKLLKLQMHPHVMISAIIVA